MSQLLNPPIQLYHYTDQAGFLGIIDNNELWATKIQYLNDNTELSLGIELTSKLLSEMLDSPHPEWQKEVINQILSEISLMGSSNMCVCSFSEKGDLLSQWRGYSKGMGGYSIGFDGIMLNYFADTEFFVLRKCIYDPENQKKEIKKVLNKILSEQKINLKTNFKENISDGVFGRYNEFIRKVSRDLSLTLPLIKNESFSEEAEWRLISNGRVSYSDLSYRPGSSMLIPYTKIHNEDLITKSVNRIIVGHTPNKELALASTRDFLKSKNLKVPVTESLIPFRNW